MAASDDDIPTLKRNASDNLVCHCLHFQKSYCHPQLLRPERWSDRTHRPALVLQVHLELFQSSQVVGVEVVPALPFNGLLQGVGGRAAETVAGRDQSGRTALVGHEEKKA